MSEHLQKLLAAVSAISWVTEKIAITNFHSGGNWQLLAEHGILPEAILCLDEKSAPYFRDERTIVNLLDGENPQEVFDRAVRELERLTSYHDKVLVHCRAGKSRSAAVVAGYLVKHQGMTTTEAVKAVQLARPCVNIMPGLLKNIGRL